MIRAIETSYAGYRFRSRLEARWAVFFTTLGLSWQYEPEGFETSAGRYLPDFKITGKGSEGMPGQPQLYFEVKGAPLRQDEAVRIAAFVSDEPQARRYLLPLGEIGDPRKACPYGDYFLHGWAGQHGRISAAEVGWYGGAASIHLSGRSGAWDMSWPGVAFHGPIDAAKMQSQFKDCWLPYIPGDCSCRVTNQSCTALDWPIGKALAAARSARFEHGETPVAPSR